MKYVLEEKACNKMLLHAAKFPSQSVNGVFLGTVALKEIVATDAFPLFHNALSLPAMTEVGLAMATTYGQTNGLQIVGYYEAPDDMRTDLTTTMTVIGDKLVGEVKEAFVVNVDGANFRPPFEDAIKVHSKTSNGWTLQTQVDVNTNGMPKLLVSKSQRQLVDFEMHLDDSTLDWMNPILD